MSIGRPLDNDNNASAVSCLDGDLGARGELQWSVGGGGGDLGGGTELAHVRGRLREFTVRPAARFSWLPEIRTAPKSEMPTKAARFSSRGSPVLYCGIFFLYFDQDLHNGTVASLPYAGDGF